MNTDTIKSEKNNYLLKLNEQMGKFHSRLNPIKEGLKSGNSPNENELGKKYKKLEECMERLSWEIHHLKESENLVDDLVRQSFNDIIDEISWRMDGVELALKGKQLWDAGDELKRGKNRIQRLKDLSGSS